MISAVLTDREVSPGSSAASGIEPWSSGRRIALLRSELTSAKSAEDVLSFILGSMIFAVTSCRFLLLLKIQPDGNSSSLVISKGQNGVRNADAIALARCRAAAPTLAPDDGNAPHPTSLQAKVTLTDFRVSILLTKS